MRGVTASYWKGRRVLVTGHTGFKGSWLSFWLTELGAEVCGFALAPATVPSLFELLALEDRLRHEVGDLRQPEGIRRVVDDFRPQAVLHLAAQPIVLTSYEDPAGTFASNVMGTAHLLDALRASGSASVCVVVTSDKCYENREQVWGYRECDALGGRDPYSASKGCQEIVTASYRASFFHPDRRGDHGLSLASGRAGNVIGGGDWGAFRLVPDLMQAFAEDEPAVVRNPGSVRPWQHVIEPLRGYLALAEAADADPSHATAYNFGPAETDTAEVRTLADALVARWGGTARWEDRGDPNARHEAGLLRLDTSLARHRLGWKPAMALADTVEATVDWYRAHAKGASPTELAALTAQQLGRWGGAT
ncbi:MAG: CDP-glucose 4,6-dehydratase [Polyangiaceae bacterium]